MTSADAFRELFFAMVDEPTAQHYEACAEALAQNPAWQPYSDDLSEGQRLYLEGDFEGAREVLLEGMKSTNLMLSPRAHMLLGFIAERTGDEQAARFERLFFFACIDALCATGDGTRDAPYKVMRTSDEYDVLSFQKKTMETQALIHGEDGRQFDCITCTDGSIVWFDITRPFSRLGGMFEA